MTIPRYLTWIVILMLAASVVFAVGTYAQAPDDQDLSVVEPELTIESAKEELGTEGLAPETPPDLATPRLAFLTYTDAMVRATEGQMGALSVAAGCLDLAKVSGLIRKERGEELATMLARIIDYSPEIDPGSIPNTTTGPPVTVLTHEAGAIVLDRGSDGAWRFSPESIGAIPEIYRRMEMSGAFEILDLTGERVPELSGGQVAQGLGIRQWIPTSWKNRTFILEDWQWLYLFLLILIGFVIDRVIPVFVRQGLHYGLRNTILKDNKALVRSASRPVGFLAMSSFLWFMLSRSGLDEGALVVLLTAAKFMTGAGIVWVTYRAVDILSDFIEHRASRTESRTDDLLAPFVRKTLKVFVVVFGIIFIASNIDINVTSLVAGLGIGGIAIALAAQDTLANLFGSITVLFDRPFQEGDWVVVGDVEGTVEELGFRSTRIRTFYNSLVTVPNSKLANANVDNYGVREFRRIKTMLSLTYNTPPDKIEAFCEGVRGLLLNHPYTRKDYYHVWLNQFSGSSLDVLLYCFLRTPEWSTELRERHRLFLDILRLAQELGVEFAFPTQTIYMAQPQPMQKVFPDDGTIKSAVDEDREAAEKRARDITTSALGGEGIVPGPVAFGDTWADDGDAGEG